MTIRAGWRNQLRRGRGTLLLFFCKIRLPTGDWRCNTKWTRYAATVRQSLFVRGELLWHFYLSTSVLPFPSPFAAFSLSSWEPADRTSEIARQPLTRRCTRKPLKAVRFCWPAIGAHRYVKMSRRFLMRPSSALGLCSSLFHRFVDRRVVHSSKFEDDCPNTQPREVCSFRV